MDRTLYELRAATIPERYPAVRRVRHAAGRAGAPAEVRRFATVVNSDLKGSTALGERLDPETLREVLTLYFDEMRAVFESHGGTIEKIIGDAIVAVFGLPVRHRRRRAACGRGGRRDAARPGHPQRPARRDLGRPAGGSDRDRDRRRRVRRGEPWSARPDGRHDGDLVGDGAERATVRGPDLAASTYDLVSDRVTVEAWRTSTRAAERRARCSRPTGSSRSRPRPRPAERCRHGRRRVLRLCAICGEENPDAFGHCGMCGATCCARRSPSATAARR